MFPTETGRAQRPTSIWSLNFSFWWIRKKTSGGVSSSSRSPSNIQTVASSKTFLHRSKNSGSIQQNLDEPLLDCICKTNKYATYSFKIRTTIDSRKISISMPLPHVICNNALDKNFTIAFSFLSQGDKYHYIFAVRQIYKIYNTYNLKPRALVTDKELAQKNALKKC